MRPRRIHSFRTRNPCVAIVEPAILDVDRRSKMATIEDGDINSNGENPSFKNILCVYNIIIWIPGPSDSRQKFVAEIGLIFQIVKKIRGRSTLPKTKREIGGCPPSDQVVASAKAWFHYN